MSNYTYMVTNKLNGKVYVGSHSWSGEGLDSNYYGSGIAITRAVKKYGKENFQVEVLYYYSTVEECRADEERILTEYNVRDCPHSYNIKNAAVGWTSEDMKGENNPNYGKRGKDTSMYGKHHTEEARRKISQAMTGEKHPLYGKHHTEEVRKKIAQAMTGENNPNYGKNFSEEQKQKMSQAHKGKKHTEEARKKISQANKGKTLSEETRKKISQANNYRKTPVVAIQKDTGRVRMFLSQHECSRVLGADQGHINKCLKGRQKTHKGYAFKYIEQLESGIYEGITGIAE